MTTSFLSFFIYTSNKKRPNVFTLGLIYGLTVYVEKGHNEKTGETVGTNTLSSFFCYPIFSTLYCWNVCYLSSFAVSRLFRQWSIVLQRFRHWVGVLLFATHGRYGILVIKFSRFIFNDTHFSKYLLKCLHSIRRF